MKFFIIFLSFENKNYFYFMCEISKLFVIFIIYLLKIIYLSNYYKRRKKDILAPFKRVLDQFLHARKLFSI